ncbi:hypothetical protein [Spirabiliibacterium falconis]|uniref:hypothetical protein n=1 Tax=Spirabiliibacterium falconis TaxID=572023 RepID=UPI001AACF707|nr:hypothetical protein [Spirabiliibacterium falconis]MBE2894960.1 hypothetical protein [Spirabiliibacterium falconis]
MHNLDKLINSSILATFFIGLGWSVAYVYGWAQSYYYGYPWELVDVGIANIARSIGYVLFLSFIAAILYLLGLACLLFVKPHLPSVAVKVLRTFIFCTILSAPILIQIFLFMHRINYLFIGLYLSCALSLSIIFRNKLKSINNTALLTAIQKRKLNMVYTALFCYCYFVISAFMVGYYRPLFRVEYPVLTLAQKRYYVLAKSDDKLILTRSLEHENTTFYLTPCAYHPENLCAFTMTKTHLSERD